MVRTEDGSFTLYSDIFGATYHSKFGAFQEARHIFLNAGLETAYKVHSKKLPFQILEVGFGTGLNAWLTAEFAHDHNFPVSYTAYEKFPIEPELIDALNYHELTENPLFTKELFQKFHEPAEARPITPYFELAIETQPIEQLKSELAFDLVYYDAFGPSEQPEMWEEPILRKVFNSMTPGGSLVTYCAQGAFKRTLKGIGFRVEPLAGPPGKREITRAIKPDQH